MSPSPLESFLSFAYNARCQPHLKAGALHEQRLSLDKRMPRTYQGSFRARRLRCTFRPLLLRTIQQQEHMVENVSTHNATFFLDQQIPASKSALQEQEVQYHDGRKAPAPVKAHQFVPPASQQWHAQLLDGSLGQQGNVCLGIQE